MNRVERMVRTSLAVAFALLFWGCATGNGQAPQLSSSGAHPAGWLQQHWAEFAKNPDQCSTCHGSTSDPGTSGGISKVSCFTCHATAGHPVGWQASDQHGMLGAKAAPTDTTGFVHCAKCHGSDYTGGLTSTSCFTCHKKAPHPDKPWRGTTASNTNHDSTDPGNAPGCFKCHANGAHSTLVPTTPAPAGTAPGCFNNTMCHSNHF